MSDMRVYSLTGLTRTASQSRRYIIQGFDIPARGLIVFCAGILPSLFMVVIFWLFIGQYAIIFFPLVEIGVFYLVEGRSRTGLHLRTYRTIYDRRTAAVGKFYCCGAEIFPASAVARTTISSSMTMRRASASDEILAMVDANRATPKRGRTKGRRSSPRDWDEVLELSPNGRGKTGANGAW